MNAEPRGYLGLLESKKGWKRIVAGVVKVVMGESRKAIGADGCSAEDQECKFGKKIG